MSEVMAQLMTDPSVRMEPAATEKMLNTNVIISIQRLLVCVFSFFPLLVCLLLLFCRRYSRTQISTPERDLVERLFSLCSG